MKTKIIKSKKKVLAKENLTVKEESKRWRENNKHLLDDKALKKWKEDNSSDVLTEENPSEFLGPRGLELIENLEGHKDIGLKMVDGIPTNHYGITQYAIDGLRELTTQYNVKVPEWIIGAHIEDLTREQCADITMYNAMINSKYVNNKTNGNFLSWTLPEREAMLAYFHNLSPYKLNKGLENKSPGSVLYHIQNNDKYSAARALLEKGDGTFYGEYVKDNGERDGYIKRALASVFALENPTFSFSASEAAELENKLRNKGYVKEAHDNLKDIADYCSVYNINNALVGDANDCITQFYSEATDTGKEKFFEPKEDKSKEQAPQENTDVQAKPTKNPSFFDKVVDVAKNAYLRLYK